MIKLIKLITGEEIISNVTIEDNSMILKKPQKFMLTSEGLGSMPFMPFSKDETFKISLDHVLVIADPEDDFLNSYNAQHGSGIVVPKNNIILKD